MNNQHVAAARRCVREYRGHRRHSVTRHSMLPIQFKCQGGTVVYTVVAAETLSGWGLNRHVHADASKSRTGLVTAAAPGLTSLCRAISVLPSNASDTTATSKLAPHLQQHTCVKQQRHGQGVVCVCVVCRASLAAAQVAGCCCAVLRSALTHPPDVSRTVCQTPTAHSERHREGQRQN